MGPGLRLRTILSAELTKARFFKNKILFPLDPTYLPPTVDNIISRRYQGKQETSSLVEPFVPTPPLPCRVASKSICQHKKQTKSHLHSSKHLYDFLTIAILIGSSPFALPLTIASVTVSSFKMWSRYYSFLSITTGISPFLFHPINSPKLRSTISFNYLFNKSSKLRHSPFS